MTTDISNRISQAVHIIKEEVREDKAQGKSPGKILNKYGNNCYILYVLEEVGIENFESKEEMNSVINLIAEEVAKEIVRNDTNRRPKCDIYEFKKE